MKMILDHPQAPGCGSYSVVAARTGVQVIKLRREDELVLNLGEQDQKSMGCGAGLIPRSSGWRFGWPATMFTGSGQPVSIAAIFGGSAPNGRRQAGRRLLLSTGVINNFGAKRLRESSVKVIH